MKPIIFNTEMVKAILNGRKMQNRRVFSKTQLKYFDYAQKLGEISSLDNLHENNFAYILQFSQYKIGDILYVREPTRIIEYTPVGNYGGSWNDCDSARYEYLSDREIGTLLEIPERFNVIPKWIKNCQGVPNGCLKEMARIFLKVTNVRVERLQEAELQDICEEGYPEGYQPFYFTSDLKRELHENKMDDWWINLWNSTTKDGYKYLDNPYVFVYEFERVKI